MQAKLDGSDIERAIARHRVGDWEDLAENDWVRNDEALQEESRILSTTTRQTAPRFWVITEGDRSATMVLLPEEY